MFADIDTRAESKHRTSAFFLTMQMIAHLRDRVPLRRSCTLGEDDGAAMDETPHQCATGNVSREMR